MAGAHAAFCLPDPAGPTPAQPSAEPVRGDFSASTSWQALHFTPAQALRYRYTYRPTVSGCGLSAPAAGTSFSVRAEGDLDSDGVFSTFERSARITGPGELSADPVLHIRDRVE
jgi:hypothetical protein